MPIYLLGELPVFPNPEAGDESGILAVGGDLSPGRLLAAYRRGIFPWFEEDQPILWWSPDPRMVLEPDGVKISRSLRKVLRRGTFEIRMDTAFAEVIHACGVTRKETGTWITPEMESAYIDLHRLGYAHSVESWLDGELVGGLYGVYIGRCFCGESMFSIRPDASKVALVALAEYMKAVRAEMIDCQLYTEHLERMGAREIPRRRFLLRLRRALRHTTDRRKWPATGNWLDAVHMERPKR